MNVAMMTVIYFNMHK